METFAIKFCKYLISEFSIKDAYEQAKLNARSELTFEGQSENSYQRQSKNSSSKMAFEEYGDGAILLPIGEDLHTIKLFDHQSRLDVGDPKDSSKIKCPNKLDSLLSYEPFTGRQIEIHQALKYLQKESVKIINVTGESGIGKTRYIGAIAFKNFERFEFKNGIFYIDLKRLNVIEKVKEKIAEGIALTVALRDLPFYFKDKSILLILDNTEAIQK